MNSFMRLLCGAAAVLTLCGAPVQTWAGSSAILATVDEPTQRHAETGRPAHPEGFKRRSGGPYSMLLRSPVLAERYLGMTDYLRFETSLPKHLNEMAILIEARLWDAQYEWWAHDPIAVKAGLSQAIINDIRDGRRPINMKPDEAVVYDVCVELLGERNLTDATFQKAKTILGEQQTIDLVAVAGPAKEVNRQEDRSLHELKTKPECNSLTTCNFLSS
jgi:hypothetical protein